MNNKIIEKSFLIHIAIFCILFVVLKNNYGFDIFDETSKVIDEYKVIALEEVDTLIFPVIVFGFSIVTWEPVTLKFPVIPLGLSIVIGSELWKHFIL